MSWARLDDAMWAHPKMLALSGDAGWLWARALSWASGQASGGLVPEAALGILTAHIDARWRRRRVAELVDAGLWDPVDGGWRIHDFAEYQPQQPARREAVRAVRSEAGRRGAHRRWHADRPDPACPLCHSAPQADGDPVWPAEASNGHAQSPPVRAEGDHCPVDNSVPAAAGRSHNGDRSETDRRQIGDRLRGNGDITRFSMANGWPRPVRVPDANPVLLEGEGGVGGGGGSPRITSPDPRSARPHAQRSAASTPRGPARSAGRSCRGHRSRLAAGSAGLHRQGPAPADGEPGRGISHGSERGARARGTPPRCRRRRRARRCPRHGQDHRSRHPGRRPMNVPTITIDRTEAKKAYTEYREEVRRRHDDELAAIARGYRHAGKGRALLRVGQAISEAGVDGQGLPRLAIARAHAHWCHVSVSSDGRVAFGEEAAPSWRARVSVRRFPADTLPAAVGAVFWRDWPKRAMAMVPIVPPALRPRHHLRNYHVLWEAEWRRQPPEDPMLLKSLGGDLYAVLATWDLTELEQAVLAGRQVE